jgi:hypothetical protein
MGMIYPIAFPPLNFPQLYITSTPNRPSPFDSQNTFFTGAMIKDYFLYPHVGRMDDIWASYYVQAKGYESNHLVGPNPTSPPLPLCSKGLTSVSWFDPQIAPQGGYP